ncbi:hypothetical protein C9F11_43300 (plasmid) [Streptomyces sp. YIM 121038]|uniref:hypothetical protein n=1 Tax=Streptomyces sp. YIM 121038 TaxID=2136401 RepID=UPI001110EB81|nr:hypothetical protein [Streptomyces sp. YIM 121038]QCX82240.1 hypothetical protein C9F11_43300 [Streptomyces sp. YIM 121038]
MDEHRTARHPLSYVRAERGWSLERLARLLALAAERRGLRYTPGRDRVWAWEQGQTPSCDYQLLLADVLSLDPRLPDQMPWPAWLPAFEAPRPFTPADSRAVLEEALMPDTPDRRAFLAYTSSALLAVAASWPGAAPLPLTSRGTADRVDGELVDWLEQRAGDLAELTPRLPAANRLVDAHLRTCLQVITDGSYSPQCGRRLHAIAARLAQTSGWRAFDQGRHAAAQLAPGPARRAAHHRHRPGRGGAGGPGLSVHLDASGTHCDRAAGLCPRRSPLACHAVPAATAHRPRRRHHR